MLNSDAPTRSDSGRNNSLKEPCGDCALSGPAPNSGGGVRQSEVGIHGHMLQASNVAVSRASGFEVWKYPEA